MNADGITNIAVIGGGTMGPGIAQEFARHGYSVNLWDRSSRALEKAQSVVKVILEVLQENGIVEGVDVEQIQSRITMARSIEDAVQNADLIVEAIIEHKEEKKRLFELVDQLCQPDTIFASNTSYLNIFELVPSDRLPQTVIAHWFAPPHIIPLVEVVRGPETSETTMSSVIGLLKRIGKVVVRIEKFVPGFVINRIQRSIGRETFFLLDNGYVTAEQLDLAVKASLAPRMMLLGVVQRHDFTGLDLSAMNLQNEAFIEPPIDNQPKSLFDRVCRGDLGVKTGKGFFDYSEKKYEDILRERDNLLLKIFELNAWLIKTTVGVTTNKKIK